MARVSLFEGGNIAAPQATDARFQPANFGPGIGQGVEQLGEGMGQAAEVANKIGELHDEAVVKEGANFVNQHYAEIGYTGPNAYYDKQGKDALDLRPTVEKSLDEEIKQRRLMLQNERQRRMFDEAITPQRQQWGIQIAQHAAKETATYAATESAARAGMTAEMAGLTYLNSPQEGEQHLDTMRAEIANQGHLSGWGSEKIQIEQFKATSGVYQDIGRQIAGMGPQGWDLARAFVKQHEGSMTDDARSSVLERADTEQHAYEAEQRRIEADARRQANEAKRDARDRVDSGLYRLEHDGIPLKPEEYSAIHADAVATGDANLVRRVDDSQFKNGLNIQYQNATPYQLQARVNDLNTKIAQAGTKAQPNDVIERDHLTTMLGNSREQLKVDPLAWGAQHLGIDVKPLVLSDPNSVRARMSAVATVAKNTGMPVSPLQRDEILAAQGTLAHGDTGQKIALALKLSQFGPMAGAAAEQVTNNTGFLNLIGLATHSNRGVAASRVNQVVTGYDVLKTKPKLIDKTAATLRFNQLTGNAFQFLPQVRDGVLSNAQAMLAARSNETGASEWSETQKDWPAAVNEALGAYNRNGARVGGLWTFNGGTTVLPENMTGTEFESRISKSNGPEFRKAQNGDPVYADGRMPTATDLKRMQWVPSGDGIYRLSDGNGFLKTKAGGFYEIDVSKLNSFDAQLAAHGYSRH